MLVVASTIARGAGADIRVVVHPSLGIEAVSSSELSKIFLKRLRTWKNGQAALPVDQVPESPARGEFSKRVHERSVVSIEVYWKRMIFSGRAVPPRELTSDQEVLEFVRSNPGAVGYVDAAHPTPGVRTLRLAD